MIECERISSPTDEPTDEPTADPTMDPTRSPTLEPTPSQTPDDEQMFAVVDVNGSAVTATGYSMQTEFIGLLSVVTVLVFYACMMMCRRRKDENEYEALEEGTV